MARDLAENIDSLKFTEDTAHSSGQCQVVCCSVPEDITLTTALIHKVFGNELVRDKIFNYVSCNYTEIKNKLANKDILTCRLVNHTWLDYVTSWLHSSVSPQFTLDFKYWQESNESQDCRHKTYQVKKFLETWAAFPNAEKHIPLFNLVLIQPSIRTNANLETGGVTNDLLKCLERCGHGLRNLGITMPISNADSGAFHNINVVPDIGPMYFPNLTDLFVYQLVFTPFVTLLISLILSACERLKCLSLVTDVSIRQAPLSRLYSEKCPLDEIGTLPNTLEDIQINVAMTSKLLAKLFLGNSLPNLTTLTLATWKEEDAKDVIFCILDRFSHQLKFLDLQLNFEATEHEHETNLSLTHIKVPIMSKLKSMTVHWFHCEHKFGLGKYFPALETLQLNGQSTTKVLKWTQSSLFNFVKKLMVHICAPYTKDHTFTLELSQRLHLSFPYVQTLDLRLGVWGEQGSIQNIFQHMTQLCELRILLKNTYEILGSSTSDAILLGVSTEYAQYLASYLQCWDSIDLSNHQTTSCSIVNLSRLVTLELCADMNGRTYDDLLISDVSFWFAFLRMPCLHKLSLTGRFRASEKMKQEWKNRGRVIHG